MRFRKYNDNNKILTTVIYVINLWSTCRVWCQEFNGVILVVEYLVE